MRWLLPWILAASSILQVSLETAGETCLLQTHFGLIQGGLGDPRAVNVGKIWGGGRCESRKGKVSWG